MMLLAVQGIKEKERIAQEMAAAEDKIMSTPRGAKLWMRFVFRHLFVPACFHEDLVARKISPQIIINTEYTWSNGRSWHLASQILLPLQLRQSLPDHQSSRGHDHMRSRTF